LVERRNPSNSGNGGKAEKNEELVKNTPFINQSEDSILI
jgi:hypothetical protein